MGQSYTGSCACGSVQVSIAGEPAGPYQCYCRQCRHASGGGPATFVMVSRAAVRIQGQVTTYEEPTKSGRRASRSFCPKCGTAVFSEPFGDQERIAVKLSVFDEAPWAEIKAVCWTVEAPAWVGSEQRARRFSTQP